MDKNLDDLIKDIKETQADITMAESIAYNEQWKDKIIPVPAPFVNWDLIVSVLCKEPKNIEILGRWDSKLEESNELEEILGLFGSFQNAFVNYVNFTRLAFIKKNISAFTSIGYLDLMLDDNGLDKYVVNSKVEGDEAVNFLEKYINAYENFKE